jgi:hypothetical protein
MFLLYLELEEIDYYKNASFQIKNVPIKTIYKLL